MMTDNKEQRICVRFCFRLGKSTTETVLKLQEAFKEEALSMYTTDVKNLLHVSAPHGCHGQGALTVIKVVLCRTVTHLHK